MICYTWRYNDELYHHGVKGMKWGVRHDDKRRARLATRELNKLDKSLARDISLMAGQKRAISSRKAKYNKYSLKGNSVKAEKQKKRLVDMQKRYEYTSTDALKKYNKITNSLYKISKSKKYVVNAREKMLPAVPIFAVRESKGLVKKYGHVPISMDHYNTFKYNTYRRNRIKVRPKTKKNKYSYIDYQVPTPVKFRYYRTQG